MPLFNPGEEETENAALNAYRVALQNSDAVMIACPEYAHGIPGAFKNALDWVVGSAEFDRKPTLLLCASARPAHAPAQLAEVLRVMGARLLGPYATDLPGQAQDARATLRTPRQQTLLREWLEQLKRV